VREGRRSQLKALHAELEQILRRVPEDADSLPDADAHRLNDVLGKLTAAVKDELFPDSDVEPVFAPVDPDAPRPYGKIIVLRESAGRQTGWYDADAECCCVEEAGFFEARAEKPEHGPAAPRRKA
jgi:hypothetical protein